MRLFYVYDNVMHSPVIFTEAPNAAAAVRLLLPQVIKNKPLRDLELRETSFSLDDYTLVDWNTYKFPENQAEALSPLKLSEAQKEMLAKREEDERNYLAAMERAETVDKRIAKLNKED